MKKWATYFSKGFLFWILLAGFAFCLGILLRALANLFMLGWNL